MGLAIAISTRGLCAQNASEPGTPVPEIFNRTCSVCHGTNGAGTALGKTLHTPDLRSKLIRQKPQDALAETITRGKNKMPAFGGTLSKEQIQALAGYVRHLGTPAKTASK
jgi:cytochrome c6